MKEEQALEHADSLKTLRERYQSLGDYYEHPWYIKNK